MLINAEFDSNYCHAKSDVLACVCLLTIRVLAPWVSGVVVWAWKSEWKQTKWLNECVCGWCEWRQLPDATSTIPIWDERETMYVVKFMIMGHMLCREDFGMWYAMRDMVDIMCACTLQTYDLESGLPHVSLWCCVDCCSNDRCETGVPWCLGCRSLIWSNHVDCWFVVCWKMITVRVMCEDVLTA